MAKARKRSSNLQVSLPKLSLGTLEGYAIHSHNYVHKVLMKYRHILIYERMVTHATTKHIYA